MKLRLLIFSLTFLLGVNMMLSAQSYFFFGATAGAFASLPTDWNSKALATYARNSAYYNFIYEQYEYGAIAPSGALIFGYQTKRFALQTGVELFYNVNENFMIRQKITQVNADAFINYYYTMLNIPLAMNFYLASGPRFKLSFLIGPYFGIPVSDVQFNFDGYIDIFHDDSIDNTRKTYTSLLPQDFSSGLRFGLQSEITLGKGALTIELGYQREFFSGEGSMLLGAIFSENGSAAIENDLRKITVLSGVRITLGYKYKIMLSGAPSGGGEKGSGYSGDISNTSRYYMIVAGHVEGPLSLDDLKTLADKGALDAETKIWKKGLTDWVKADTFTEITPLLTPKDLFDNTQR
ncbi:MAG: DUF4339 domain-containing protein [Spirochaetaceae bacterium]|jgi:hypothetical protein|nr:DUF4339 domain-containing protein [Spirochaetaceae bacterium]